MFDSGRVGLAELRVSTVTTVNPTWDYKTLISHQVSATTFLSGIKYTVTGGYMTAHFFSPTAGPTEWKESLIWGVIPRGFSSNSIVPVSPGDITAVDNAAKIAIARKIKKINRQMQGGVFLGELIETIHMVRNPARALREGLDDYLYALKQRRRRATQSAAARNTILTQTLRETWLEHSFGWSPLLHDIDDGMKALADLTGPNSRAPAERVYAERDGIWASGTTDEQINIPGSVPPIWVHRTAVRKYSVRYYGMVKTVPPKSSPFRHFGVSLSDFAPTVWELVPWSFLVDYFANIGDIIDCATVQRADIAWLNRGTSDTFSCRYVPFTTAAWKPFTYVSSSPMELTTKSVERTAAGSLVPSLEFRLPLLGRKIANISALLPQLRRLTPYR